MVKIWINEKRCEGIGICVDLCPEVFELKNSIAAVKVDEDQEIPRELEEMCREAVESCPNEAIILEE